jgi:endonuclease YncB( thermonuclease family)
MDRRQAYSGAMNVPARVGVTTTIALPASVSAASAASDRSVDPRRRLMLAALVLLAPGCSRNAPDHTPRPGVLSGRIGSIADGDSFTLIADDGRRIGVRIGGIDAPEKGQPHADQSRDNLARLLARGALEIEPIKTDPYGRQVARVRAGGEDVGLRQIEAGLAWHFVRYAADQSPDERTQYAQAERDARHAARGLWADAAPVAPWLHRQRKRTDGNAPMRLA